MYPLIATPMYRGMAYDNYIASVLNLERSTSLKHDFMFKVDSNAQRVRNEYVRDFLDGPWSHLFFIDADIGFDPEAFHRVLYRNAGSTYVTVGRYPLKDESGRFVGDFGQPDQDGFAPAYEAGAGFMCIAREALRSLAEPSPFDASGSDSEDYAFCRRWIAHGGHIMADMRSVLTHKGEKLWKIADGAV